MNLQQSSGEWQWSEAAQPKFGDPAPHVAAVAQLWPEYLRLHGNASIQGKPGASARTPNQQMPRYGSEALAASYNPGSNRGTDV